MVDYHAVYTILGLLFSALSRPVGLGAYLPILSPEPEASFLANTFITHRTGATGRGMPL